MYFLRKKLVKFIKILLLTVVCSFFISLLIVLIHITLTKNITNAIFGLTLLISSIITYLYNQNIERLEYIKRIEAISSHQITVEATVHQKVNNNGRDYDENLVKADIQRDYVKTTFEQINSRAVDTGGGDYNENIGGNLIGRDSVTKNIQNITVGNREVKINPNNIIETFDEFRDILAQSIAQSSDALQAISEFAKELTEELHNRPEAKVCFGVNENINEQELVKKIFEYLLIKSYDQINEINQRNLITQPNKIQKTNLSNSPRFIQSLEYSRNGEYNAFYEGYIIELFQKESKGWLYKIRRSDLSNIKHKIEHSRNIYYAIARAIDQIDDEIYKNWKK